MILNNLRRFVLERAQRGQVAVVLALLPWRIISVFCCGMTLIGLYAFAVLAMPQTISKGCKESLEVVQAGPNRCWGWFQTHTYDLSQAMEIVTIRGRATAGPSEQTGRIYTFELRVSQDGVSWQKLGSFPVRVSTTQSTPLGPFTACVVARYVQIVAPAGAYVDYSEIAIESNGAEPPFVSPHPLYGRHTWSNQWGNATAVVRANADGYLMQIFSASITGAAGGAQGEAQAFQSDQWLACRDGSASVQISVRYKGRFHWEGTSNVFGVTRVAGSLKAIARVWNYTNGTLAGEDSQTLHSYENTFALGAGDQSFDEMRTLSVPVVLSKGQRYGFVVTFKAYTECASLGASVGQIRYDFERDGGFAAVQQVVILNTFQPGENNELTGGMQGALKQLQAAISLLLGQKKITKKIENAIANISKAQDLMADIDHWGAASAKIGQGVHKALDKAIGAINQATAFVTKERCTNQKKPKKGCLTDEIALKSRTQLEEAKYLILEVQTALTGATAVPLPTPTQPLALVMPQEEQLNRANAELLEIAIYDLTGRPVAQPQTLSGQAPLPQVLAAAEQDLANGVYFYVVTVKKTDGPSVRSEVRKLIVLR